MIGEEPPRLGAAALVISVIGVLIFFGYCIAGKLYGYW